MKSCGGLNMGLFWEIMYVLVTVLCVAVLPFAIFYYEVRICWKEGGERSERGRRRGSITGYMPIAGCSLPPPSLHYATQSATAVRHSNAEQPKASLYLTLIPLNFNIHPTHTGRRWPDGEQRPSSMHSNQVHDGLPLCFRDSAGPLLLLCTYFLHRPLPQTMAVSLLSSP